MTEAERAFYEWWHANIAGKLVEQGGGFMDLRMEAFLAGWAACIMQGVKTP